MLGAFAWRTSPLTFQSNFMLQAIRQRTYRRVPSKSNKRFMRRAEALKAEGIVLPKKERGVLETEYYKIEGNMKVYKNVCNSMRHRRHPTRFHLSTEPCIKRLSIGKRSSGGRNKSGQITCRHRGGGHKRRIRLVDFKRQIPGPHEVIRLEYDPNRSADLCLLKNLSTNEYSYIIRPKNVNIGDIVESFANGIPEPLPGEEPTPIFRLIKPGNCLMLKDIPVGTFIHNIGLRKNGIARLCRSAGTSGQLLFTGPEGNAQIRLRSKEIRLIPVEAIATIGKVANEDHHLTVLGKAGASRNRGIRPTVRGIAMSPYDHPHGGGRKSKGNKHPRTPWGWKCKGRRTRLKKRPYIIVPRWKAKQLKA